MLPDDYKEVALISTTRHAQVWKARARQSGAPVALKIARDDDKVRRRFQREIEALAAAKGAHVMPVLDFDESYDWYAMPLAERPLSDLKVPTGVRDIVEVIKAIADALRPIHERGQVHRDLKPQNVLWLNDNGTRRWVVADFGIVRNPLGETTFQLTSVGGLVGTVGWAAPELYSDAHSATPAADVFGAGAILTWMATGQVPHFGQPGRFAVPELRGIAQRAVNPDPARRYATLDDLAAAVVEATSPQPADVQSLVLGKDFAAIGAGVLSTPARMPDFVRQLPSLDRRDVTRWEASDHGGLVAAVDHLLAELRQDIGTLPFAKIDRFLSWCLIPVQVQLSRGNRSDAESLAASLFSAIADIHQFAPASDVLEWLDKLNERDQALMESALHSSTGLAFFQGRAKGSGSRKSRLVRALAGGEG